MSSSGEVTDEELSNIECYDTEDGVVLYDARNPLAWVKTDGAVELEDKL
ncbi:MAG: DUF7331 family protein [Halobacteriota archaeon]